MKRDDDQDDEALNEISLDHITLDHEKGSGSGSNGTVHKNADFDHTSPVLNSSSPSSSSPSSSPSKMGGCPSGEFICVTEICCDEIEINDKGRKHVGAGLGVTSHISNLALAAASYSEAPASGNL